VILGLRSAVLSDQDNVYPIGAMIRIDADVPDDGEKITSGTIQITSPSHGYDSSTQDLKFGSIFYLWDTTGLPPGLYNVAVVVIDSEGESATDSSLTITLAPNPPLNRVC